MADRIIRMSDGRICDTDAGFNRGGAGMKRRNYTPNDNQNVIRMLAVSFAGSAKGRNQILFLTVVLSIITLTMVFGISRGKIRSEELSIIRENGTAASGVVENGTASQYAALKSQNYIKQTGRCFTVGVAEGRRKGFRCRGGKGHGLYDQMGRSGCMEWPASSSLYRDSGKLSPKKSLRSCFPKRR